MFAAITPVLIFIAFLLLLLVSLSAPIIDNIYLFRISANVSSGILNSGASGSVRFGVWGYCASSVNVAIAGLHRSTASSCSKTMLGYTFDNAVSDELHVTRLENVISKTTTAALVLHPIAAGLTFLALLTSLFIFRRGSNGTSRLPSLLTLIIGLFAALLSTIVFLIDVIFVAVIRSKVHNSTDGTLNLTWGNGVWMALGATIALWLSMVGACAGICACGTRRRKSATY